MKVSYKNFSNLTIYRAALLLFSLIVFAACEKDVSVSPPDDIVYQGFIYVDSQPRGALIFQNGRNTGRTTPDSLRYLPSGTYTITLKLKYFRDTSFTFQLKDPELKEYFIDYFANPLMFGAINFSSDPTDVKIFINDSSIQAKTPFTLKNVVPGAYSIKYQKDNFRDAVFNVIVESNKTSFSYYKLRDTSKWVDYQLSNSSIASNLLTCIDIDLNEILWIGSFDKGLISFDGINFVNYSTANTPIQSNKINCIAINGSNDKWIGTDAGIAVFNNSTWTNYTKNNSGLPNNTINSIKFENNIAWIGTPLGLVKFDGASWTLYDTLILSQTVDYAAVNDFFIDQSGIKWLGTDNTGIFRFKDGIFGVPFRDTIPGIPSNRISATNISSKGEKWFGHLPGPEKRGGLSVYNGNSWQSIFVGTDGNLIEDIFVDKADTKWISTNEGLFQFEGLTPLHFYNRNNSLISFSHIKGTVRSNSGTVWIITYGGGLNKLKF